MSNGLYKTPKYFVTAIRSENPFENGRRCFGWFETLFAAKNYGVTKDIQGVMYDYLVIEEIMDGLNPTIKEILWFKWNNILNIWNECPKAMFSIGFTNWSGIG